MPCGFKSFYGIIRNLSKKANATYFRKTRTKRAAILFLDNCYVTFIINYVDKMKVVKLDIS